MRQQEEDQYFWKDKRGLYDGDYSELSFVENDFFQRANVKNSKENMSPLFYKYKYAYFLDGLGDIHTPLIDQYSMIIHHKENFSNPSQLCCKFFALHVLPQLDKQGLQEQEMSKEICGIHERRLEIMEIFREIQTEKEKLNQYNNAVIEKYLKEQLDSYNESDLEVYVKFIEYQLKNLVIKSQRKKKQILQERIKDLSSFMNFSLLEKTTQKKYILLCNRYNDYCHFRFQTTQQKFISKIMRMVNNTTISLKDIILSFKEHEERAEQLSDDYYRIKQQFLDKLFKHISWELKQLQKFTRKSHELGFEYPLNPSNIYLNLQKQFFFLDPTPIIIQYLLDYKEIPTTKNDFYEVEKMKRIQFLFKTPQQLTKKYERQGIIIPNGQAYKFMRVLSAVDKLNIGEKVFSRHNKFFFSRRLDDSEECRVVFGDYVHNILKRTKETFPDIDEYGPSLTYISEAAKFQFRQQESLEALNHRYWLKIQLIKFIEERLRKKIEVSKGHLEKHRITLKLMLYNCFYILIQKKTIEYYQTKQEKIQGFKEFVKKIKLLNIKDVLFQLKFTEDEGQYEKDLQQDLQRFYDEIFEANLEKIQSAENLSSTVSIKIDDQNQIFQDFYEKGKFLLDSQNTQKSEKIFYQLLGKINKTIMNWAIYDVYLKIYETNIVADLVLNQMLQKLEGIEPSYL